MARHGAAPVNILVVDDSPEKLMTFRVILTEPGQNVVAVGSGREALRCLLGQEFAVILLDVNMPGMDGFETAALIRQRRSSEQTPIIFVTAFSDETHVAQGYSLGAVDYIVAPVVPEILKSKVAVFVELFRKTEQIKHQAESLRHRADQLRRLADASLAINSALSVDSILGVVTETARDLLAAQVAATIAVAEPGRPAPRSAVSLVKSDATERGRVAAQAEILSALLGPGGPAVRMTSRELRSGRRWEKLRRDPSWVPPRGGWLAAPLSGRDGRAIGWIHVCDRRRREFSEDDAAVLTQLAQVGSIAIENTLFSEAREANRLKDEFLTILSHELRTPLTAILGWTRVLRTGAATPDRLTHGLEVIERNVSAQTRLIEDLLDVSRIIAGKLRLTLRPTALVPAVETAVEAMRPAAEAKGLALHLTVATEIAHDELIAGDADRLQQVGWNLLSNAIKFTPAGGRIEVAVTRRDDGYVIRVTDTGEGISPSFLKHVFDRFRQDDSSTTRSHGGLGIGLAIVQHIVALHGGTVAAESPGEDQGSTFTVILPILRAAQELPAPAAPPLREEDPLASLLATPAERHMAAQGAGGSVDLGGVRVLVVDDEPDAREVLGEILQDAGAAVVAAASLDEAIDRLDRAPADVLISDIAMPGGDGYELIRQVRLRGKGEGGNLPAIALSAYARDEDRRRAIAAGFESYLVKPVEPFELLATVRRMADSSRSSSPRRMRHPPNDGVGRAAAASLSRRILVVEDDADSREALKTLLELSGHQVEVAANGAEGVAKALASRPEVAVVDIGLPELDGNEVARRIRAALPGDPIFLIALTGHASENDQRTAAESGFDAHFAKPVNLDLLLRLLHDARPQANLAAPG
jgi:CheY-like chemotaxis protein